MTRKLFYNILIVVVLLVIIAGFYFVLRGTKKVKIENESIQNMKQEENNIKVVAESKEIEDITSVVEEGENVETPDYSDESVATGQESVSAPDITNKLVSWGYQSASIRSIDTIVIHSSYDALGTDPYDLDGLINEYKQYGVATHYLIDRKGNIYQLVQDKNIAYHAGVSSVPDGRNDVNNFSIGIELMNTKDDKFTDAQYNSLNELVDYLKSQYKIKYTLGHNQIASGRKDDPWNFDWNRL